MQTRHLLSREVAEENVRLTWARTSWVLGALLGLPALAAGLSYTYLPDLRSLQADHDSFSTRQHRSSTASPESAAPSSPSSRDDQPPRLLKTTRTPALVAAPPHQTNSRSTSHVSSSHSEEEDDDEVAQFETNRREWEDRESIFQSELHAQLLDETFTAHVAEQLSKLSAEIEFEVQSQALCTQTICQVQWTSSEPVETLIPLLTPWLLSQPNFAVGDGTPSDGKAPDFSQGVRVFLRKS